MERSARHVLVSGRVQGVGFRWHTRAQAEALGLAGWVRNLPDGRVEAWIEGDEREIEAMLAWLARGPTAAHVRGIEAVVRAPEGHAGFRQVR